MYLGVPSSKKPNLKRKVIFLILLNYTFIAGTSVSFSQTTNSSKEVELNAPVSNVKTNQKQAIGNRTLLQSSDPGAGESASAGVDHTNPDDSRAEFKTSPEAWGDFWELWSKPPTTAPVGIETIIGPDERFQVTPTTTYPERAIVLISFDGGRCSGWLYGRDIVATAGHCVHDGGSNGNWKQNVTVFPGRDGNSAPYGSCSAKSLHSVVGWTRNRDEKFDYGAIKLNCSIGDTTGWFGYWWQSASLVGTSTTISGYPGDKPLEHWRSVDQVRENDSNQVFYLNDTVGGMSGSAIYEDRPSGSSFCSGPCVMGIHAYGLHGSSPHGDHNHGTRITEARFNNLKNWKDAP